jgi:hypothetical protein
MNREWFVRLLEGSLVAFVPHVVHARFWTTCGMLRSRKRRRDDENCENGCEETMNEHDVPLLVFESGAATHGVEGGGP